jgi:homogentisate 1,2-dioxygenase
MLPHGPDKEAFDKASSGELKPQKLENTLAFMFETRYPQQVTEYAARHPCLQSDYAGCWLGLQKQFDPKRRQ